MKEEMLEIINENEEVVGLETRKKVHEEGLLHREIHIWFFTPNKEVILQHRAKNKDTYPNLLDATVGGHVDPGMTYEETAIKECREETGIDIKLEDLVFIERKRSNSLDPDTGLRNNSIKPQYAYLYKGDADELEVEKDKAIGFEAWKIDKLSKLNDLEKKKFIPKILSEEYLTFFEKCWTLLNKKVIDC